MARTKQTKQRSDDKGELPPPRQPSKWGTVAHSVTHRPPLLPQRIAGGNPSYIGMYTVYYLCNLYHVEDVEDLNVRTRNTCIECNLYDVEDVKDLNVRTHNTCIECNLYNVKDVEDLNIHVYFVYRTV